MRNTGQAGTLEWLRSSLDLVSTSHGNMDGKQLVAGVFHILEDKAGSQTTDDQYASELLDLLGF